MTIMQLLRLLTPDSSPLTHQNRLRTPDSSPLTHQKGPHIPQSMAAFSFISADSTCSWAMRC